MSENLNDWDRPALMNEARENFGVKFDPKMSKDEMIKKLVELRAGELAQMEDGPDEDDAPRSERRVRIKIHRSDGPDGNNDVKVGLNGRAYVIKRNVEVDIPESVFKACIEGSVFTVYEPVNNKQTGQIDITERDVNRFAYTMYGYADQLGEIKPQDEARPSGIRHNLR